MTSNDTSHHLVELATVAGIQAKEAGLDDGDNMLPEEAKKEKRRQRSQLFYGQGGIIDGVSSLIDRGTAEGGVKVVEGKGYAVGTIRVRTKKELFRQGQAPGPLCKKLDYPSYQRGVKVLKLKEYDSEFFTEQVMTGLATVKEAADRASEVVSREETPVKFYLTEFQRSDDYEHSTQAEVEDELVSILDRRLTRDEASLVKKRMESPAWSSANGVSSEVYTTVAEFAVKLASALCPDKDILLEDLVCTTKQDALIERQKALIEETEKSHKRSKTV